MASAENVCLIMNIAGKPEVTILRHVCQDKKNQLSFAERQRWEMEERKIRPKMENI